MFGRKNKNREETSGDKKSSKGRLGRVANATKSGVGKVANVGKSGVLAVAGILSKIFEPWPILIFILFFLITSIRIGLKSSSMNEDVVNKDIQISRSNPKEASVAMQQLKSKRGQNVEFGSIRVENNLTDTDFEFVVPLQTPMNGSLFLDTTKSFLGSTWMDLFRDGNGKYVTTLNNRTIEWLKNGEVNTQLGKSALYNDFSLANFQFLSSYRSYLYVDKSSGGTHFYCHPLVIRHAILNGARCVHFDVFSDLEGNPVVYYGTKARQLSKNIISLRNCFLVVAELMSVNAAEFDRDGSEYFGKHFLHDPMFIALTLKTSNTQTISEINDLYNSIFKEQKYSININSDPRRVFDSSATEDDYFPTKVDYSKYLGHQPIWEYYRKVSLISSPIGDQLAVHNSFFDQGGMSVKKGDDNGIITGYCQIVQHFWGVPMPNICSYSSFNIQPENQTYSSQNMYNVQQLTDELKGSYRDYTRHYLSMIFPCNAGGSICEIANIYCEVNGQTLSVEKEQRRQNALRVMINNPPQNSCQLKFDKVWNTGAQFVFMYFQRSQDTPFIDYLNKFVKGGSTILSKFGLYGGLGPTSQDRFTLYTSAVGVDTTELDQANSDAAEGAANIDTLTKSAGGGANKRWKSGDWKVRLQQTANLIHQLQK